MFKNYFKIALRNLYKQKFYSIINISGLAVGIACCLLIVLFVQDEVSFDRHHEKTDQIVRITSDIQFGGNHMQMVWTPAPMAAALTQDYPEVLAATRFARSHSRMIKLPETEASIEEQGGVFADPNVFDVFTFPLIKGNPATALSEPASMVITERMAQKYFGEEDPMGKVLIVSDQYNYTVKGIMENPPENGHFKFEYFLTMLDLEDAQSPIWLSNNYYTYLLLDKGVSAEQFAEKLPEVVKKYAIPQAKQFMDITEEDFINAGNHLYFLAQSMKDIHLTSSLSGELRPNGSIMYVWIFSAIALFILLLACINFMNLSTARSSRRAREVGVRKVLGSFRSQLVKQFLIESILISFVAILFSVLLAEVFMPVFNQLAGKSLNIPLFDPLFVGILLLCALVIGVLAGIYPAFFLSSFNPIQVIKGKLSTSSGSRWVRSGLVVFQFTTSIILIIGTLVVYQQLQYTQNKQLGFTKEQVIMISGMGTLDEQAQSYQEEMLRLAEVKSATMTGFLPVNSWRSDNVHWKGNTPIQENSVSMQNWNVDHNYIPTMEMEIIAGRNFSIDFPTDSQAVILNETAVRNYGWTPETALGEFIHTYAEMPDPNSDRPAPTFDFKVIGVVKDFHFESLRENITSLGLRLGGGNGYLCLRVKGEEMGKVIASAEENWDKFTQKRAFDYTFMDDRFGRMYNAEQRIGKIFAAFAVLAILVACLGLFALSAFVAEQRTKEIGIRKVLGASISNIVVLLSKEFTWLVLIALVIAVPISWYFMDMWLEDFVYHISISPLLFITAGILALVIAWLTVSYQSLRAALANPIDALKEE